MFGDPLQIKNVKKKVSRSDEFKEPSQHTFLRNIIIHAFHRLFIIPFYMSNCFI